MSSPKWTKEQQAVIDSRNSNLLVAAAAGSGKTAVLVERIIQMITDKDNPIDIDKLLVVTFTNAAASEMRERIGDAIGKALDKEPENTHLQKQLVLLNKASITTIHSFCLEVIKSNFHKINLDPNFRIGDTTECTLLKQEAIEDVFEALYVEQNEGFLNLIESYAEKRGDSNVQDIILGIYNFSMASPDPKKWLEDSAEKFNRDDNFDFSKSDWAKSILGTVYMEIEGIESSMKKSLEELYGIEELETYLPKFRNDYEGIKRILDACDEKNDNAWNDTFMAMSSIEFENYTKGVKRLPKDTPDYITDIKKRADDIRKNAKKTVQDMVSSIFRKENDDIKEEIKYLYKIVKSISDTVLKFEEAYSNKKRDKGIIDFNDIEHFALKILIQKDEDGKDIPSDIALSYREKFEEIFIDEYQDSNFVQEVLLSNIAKIKTPNRFMVGDVKQSIYRFRQAKPEIFLDKYSKYDTEKGALHRKIMLYKNFRSREEVVNCANYIFENTMSKQIGDIDYTEDERLNLGAVFKENENENAIVGGPSEIHIIQTKANINDSKDDNDKELSDEEEEEIDNIQIEARMVGKIIQEMMNPKSDGKIQMVYDKKLDDYRPVEFKDIVILLRATSAWAPVFADELMNMDIPTYADIGVGYFETIEIKTIMSLLQVIDNPMQDIPLLAVLKSPICGFTPEELIDIRVEDNQRTFYEALEKYSNQEDEIGHKCLDFLNKLQDYKEKSLYMSTDEFLWYLYTKTGYFAYVGALPGGSQRQANLKILFERAKQFEETSFKGIFNFINFISKLKKSNTDMGSAKTLGENANVVRIMSIHKSKGLEFPVVIMAGLNKQINKMDARNRLVIDQELGIGTDYVNLDKHTKTSTIIKGAVARKILRDSISEEERVLYVAMTRAREKLIMIGSVTGSDKKMSAWQMLSVELASNGIYSYAECENIDKYSDMVMPVALMDKALNSGIFNVCIITSDEDVVCDTAADNDQVSDTDNVQPCVTDNTRLDEGVPYIKEKASDMHISELPEYIKDPDRKVKVTVSELKKMQEDSDYDINAFMPDDIKAAYKEAGKDELEAADKITNQEKAEDEDFVPTIPDFISDKEETLRANERGTAYHRVMECLDYNKIESLDDVKADIKKMLDSEKMNSMQAGCIKAEDVYEFVKSPIGQRIKEAVKKNNVRREQPFMFEYDRQLVQGVIDLYMIEDDKIVLVDYKTDRVKKGKAGEQELIRRYSVQLDYYALALVQLTGLEVKEKIIYSFALGKQISLE